MKDKELLPCPFCGEPAEKPFMRINSGWFIDCSGNSDCRGKTDTWSQEGYDSMEFAIEAWNTRVNTRPSQEADWEREFENRFGNFTSDRLIVYENELPRYANHDDIKSFIRTLLKPEGKEDGK